MRRIVFVLILIPLLLLCGCSDARQVENQAYVIAMGLDRASGGQLEISVQVPKISGSAASEDGGKSSGNYLPISVSGSDYESTLERLSWSIPRNLNLSQIKLIIFSREIASEENFREILEHLFHTEQLFAAANVVICEGSAKAFIEALTPMMGTRLSEDMETTIEHYQKLGVLPECSLANLIYSTYSSYSDPMVGYAVLSEEKTASKSVAALSDAPKKQMQEENSDIRTRFQGAALFANGSFKGILNGEQTIMASLINNSLDSFRFICGGDTLEFSPMGQCHIKVDTDSEPPHIEISLNLSVSGQQNTPDVDLLRSTLENAMRNTIDAARQLGTDPFGFADAAARNFPTQQKWQDYQWQKRFQNAAIEIKLRFSHADA